MGPTDRRSAARRVSDLNRELDSQLFVRRSGRTEDQRQRAGRRADDIQAAILAIRHEHPTMTLLECSKPEEDDELELSPTELWMEHKGWAS